MDKIASDHLAACYLFASNNMLHRRVMGTAQVTPSHLPQQIILDLSKVHRIANNCKYLNIIIEENLKQQDLLICSGCSTFAGSKPEQKENRKMGNGTYFRIIEL